MTISYTYHYDEPETIYYNKKGKINKTTRPLPGALDIVLEMMGLLAKVVTDKHGKEQCIVSKDSKDTIT